MTLDELETAISDGREPADGLLTALAHVTQEESLRPFQDGNVDRIGNAAEYVAKFYGAVRYSVSVGGAGINVTIEFDTPGQKSRSDH